MAEHTAGVTQTTSQRAALPLELRAVLALLVLDLLAGLWLHLHAPGWVALFLAHLPAVGFFAAVWGLLGDGTRERCRSAVQSILASRVAGLLVVITLAVLFVLSLFASSVHVDALDPGARSRMRLADGEPRLVDSADLRAANAKPFNHLTAPVSFPVWTWLGGRRMWLFDGHLASGGFRVFPWVPIHRQYPDDFDTVATIAVLPTPRLANDVDSNRTALLTLRDATEPDSALAIDTLRSGRGILFGFPTVTFPDTADSTLSARARGYATSKTDPASTPDSLIQQNAKSTLRSWFAPETCLVARPIVVGERIIWELTRLDGARMYSGTTRVNHAITYVHLDR